MKSKASVFPDNKCELRFRPDLNLTEGVNLLMIAHRRYLEIGTYDIDCKIGDKVIEMNNVTGMFEHVWSRI